MDPVSAATAAVIAFGWPHVDPIRGAKNSGLPTPIAANSEPIWTVYIAEAAQRFGIPESWIHAVIDAESADRNDAISRKGALGLMQLMPETYEEMRSKLGLGNDPFDPRDNILAGTAYIREMLDRYGVPDFLAAYNAGPERFEASRVSSRRLPDETLRFVADVASKLGFGTDLEREKAASESVIGTVFELPNPDAVQPSWRRLFFVVRSAPNGTAESNRRE